MSTVNDVLKRILDVVLIGFMVVGAFLLCSRLFGLRLYAVQTESMQSSYPKGSLIGVLAVEPEDIGEGDVISFVVSTDAVVTHRVVENDTAEELIYTKGDENDSEDSEPVAYENVLGRAVFGIPYVGYAVLFVDTAGGKALLGIAAVLAALYLVVSGAVRLYTWDLGESQRKHKGLAKNREKESS